MNEYVTAGFVAGGLWRPPRVPSPVLAVEVPTGRAAEIAGWFDHPHPVRDNLTARTPPLAGQHLGFEVLGHEAMGGQFHTWLCYNKELRVGAHGLLTTLDEADRTAALGDGDDQITWFAVRLTAVQGFRSIR
ncbi:hypothetical protein [Actinoplanes sp. NBRC 101535]|uniref:hypothetical protein n=1 Tax=Actinoplanes sp. NBRC 101535 TaxID=3032196 RepID=UPI0024A1AE4A|nr:hypothetical protein [Actinoplanes sp. NBRC 101535]GLY07002.1 hypothetical protein Acsp01_73810 [Actinoplanes sp. NBRC 101535]